MAAGLRWHIAQPVLQEMDSSYSAVFTRSAAWNLDLGTLHGCDWWPLLLLACLCLLATSLSSAHTAACECLVLWNLNVRSFVCFSAHGALGSMDVPRRGQAINTQEELQCANWVAAILSPCPYAEQLPAFSHASTSSRLVTFVPWIPVGSHPLAFLASRHTSKRSSETRLQLHHERCFPHTTQFDKSTDQACSVLRGSCLCHVAGSSSCVGAPSAGPAQRLS